MLFFTYALLISGGAKGARLDHVVDWLSRDKTPLIIFDECHRCKNALGAGNSKPSKTAITAMALQQRLPDARVVYASATGASTPENLAYMVRLGAFGMSSFEEMLGTLKRSGLGSLELFSMGCVRFARAVLHLAQSDVSAAGSRPAAPTHAGRCRTRARSSSWLRSRCRPPCACSTTAVPRSGRCWRASSAKWPTDPGCRERRATSGALGAASQRRCSADP